MVRTSYVRMVLKGKHGIMPPHCMVSVLIDIGVLLYTCCHGVVKVLEQ